MPRGTRRGERQETETALYVEFAVANRSRRNPADTRTCSLPALLFGAAVFELREGENVIGRGYPAAVDLASPVVSRRHARITVSGGRATLEDLGSRNGTFVGERRVSEPAELADTDEIRIGPLWLIFQAADSPQR